MKTMAQKLNFNVDYHREYGTKTIANGSSADHLASYPNWEETIRALRADLPQNGRILTPELITAPNNFSDIPRSGDLIRRRIEIAKRLTTKTDAELYLGTPYQPHTSSGTPVWHNSVVALKKGHIIGITHKDTLLDAEKKFGLSRPQSQHERSVRNGSAVLICAELYDYPYHASPSFKQKAHEIIAPTMWAFAADSSSAYNNAVERAGGYDPYFRGRLESTISADVLRRLQGVDRVTVVDRGNPTLGVKPYNAVFTRTT